MTIENCNNIQATHNNLLFMCDRKRGMNINIVNNLVNFLQEWSYPSKGILLGGADTWIVTGLQLITSRVHILKYYLE